MPTYLKKQEKGNSMGRLTEMISVLTDSLPLEVTNYSRLDINGKKMHDEIIQCRKQFRKKSNQLELFKEK